MTEQETLPVPSTPAPRRGPDHTDGGLRLRRDGTSVECETCGVVFHYDIVRDGRKRRRYGLIGDPSTTLRHICGYKTDSQVLDLMAAWLRETASVSGADFVRQATIWLRETGRETGASRAASEVARPRHDTV